jgi:transcriptional regulator with XRE-family HTH domain
MLTAAQIRAARGLLGWSQQKLADHAKLSLTSLNRIERSDGDPRMSSILAIETALSRAGVRFINDRDGTIGVTIRPKRPKAG